MSDLREKISFKELTEPHAAAASDEQYDSWKEEKIRHALKQSEDRSKMTPARKVWERFGFER
ncbi:hypothetical protein ABCW43_03660 [Neorhizobium sp. IRAMC:178]|uniref:hypothetical protein n=1 Tax=Neorhizobium tunisiense TaxID=3144793 RepID=UPI0031F71F2F